MTVSQTLLFLMILTGLRNTSKVYYSMCLFKNLLWCNAGDPGLLPESGRSAGEGIGYPPQYSWASLVAQLGKNLPAMC